MTIFNVILVTIIFLLVSLLIATPIALLLIWLLNSEDEEEYKDVIRYKKGDRKWKIMMKRKNYKN